MSIINWVLVGSIAVVLIICLATTIAAELKLKKNKVKQKNQTTYTNSNQNEVKTEAIISTDVSLRKGDIIIEAQKTIIASENGTLHPGKYSILSAESNVDSFNVRIGKFVKEYHHGDVVVIADGEEVTPTSPKIILR